MTVVRALKDFETSSPTNARVKVRVHAGQLVDVCLDDELQSLRRRGLVVPPEYSHAPETREGVPADPYSTARRVGIWLWTSPNYSGGRIHMYQYALALDALGCEVFYISNAEPAWARDYRKPARMRFLHYQKDLVPGDLDLIVTDSKTEVGALAAAHKSKHPSVPFICFSFETPNWVEQFVPEYARSLAESVRKDAFQEADLLVANSAESLKWLLPWVGGIKRGAFLYPAVNTDVLAEAEKIAPAALGIPEPYAVISARGPRYKCGDLAVEAIRELPFPFHLVCFGEPTSDVGTEEHQIIHMRGRSDAEKYAALRGARFALAPSLFEGCGMVPMEALAVGTPTIAFDLPVLREVYGDRVLYAPHGDRAHLKALVRQEAERSQHAGMEKRAPATSPAEARETWGLEAMAKKVETLPFHPSLRPKVSAQLIAYWGFIPEALESVYPHVDEVIVAFGPDAFAQKIDDGSLDALRAFPDPDGKIRIEARSKWESKLEMRQWCADRITGTHLLMLDGDEIWVGLERWIKDAPAFGCPRWVNLWHGGAHWVRDYDGKSNRWGARLDPWGSTCPHYRWSWWRASYRFRTHPVPVDRLDNPLYLQEGHLAEAASRPDCAIYHLGHALPRKVMAAKHAYYEERDGRDAGRLARRKAWEDWNGVDGDCGDGIVEPVTWEIPEIVRRAVERVRGKETE